RYSSQVKPISYLKANAAEILTNLAEQREPMVITQNGEAKAVLQDVASYEETQETLVLLKILALGNQDVAAGKVKPVADVAARLRAKRASIGGQAHLPGLRSCSPRVQSRTWKPPTTTSPGSTVSPTPTMCWMNGWTLWRVCRKYRNAAAIQRNWSALGSKNTAKPSLNPTG